VPDGAGSGRSSVLGASTDAVTAVLSGEVSGVVRVEVGAAVLLADRAWSSVEGCTEHDVVAARAAAAASGTSERIRVDTVRR